jgi:hypothetical protein
MNPKPGVVWRRNPDQSREAVVVPHAYQRVVCRVHDDLADPCVLEQRTYFASSHVHRHEIAVREIAPVVVGEERDLLFGVERKRSDAVELSPLDVGKMPNAAIASAQRADVLDDSGVPKASVKHAGCFVVVGPGHRPHRVSDQPARRSDRKLAHSGQVLALKLMLEPNPILPCLLDRHSEHLLESVGPVARTSFVASVPGDYFLGSIHVCKPREEPCAIQVGVHDTLKIDLDAP